MKLTAIDTGFFKLDGGAMFGVVPKSIWHKLNPADENNMCNWAMRCLLVEDGNRLVLIDTGIGTKQDPRFFSYYYLSGDASLQSSIEKAGYSIDEVTDVVLTHLHFDHVGGAVQAVPFRIDVYEPTFKNATYHVNGRQWDWAVAPNAREKASFLKENFIPLEASGQLNKLADDAVLFPGFEMLYVNGHTEGMLLPKIDYKGHTILYMADLVPSAGHVAVNYVMSYDVRPLVTMEEKNAILRAAEEDQWVLMFEHDPVNECGLLARTERGIRLERTFALSELG